MTQTPSKSKPRVIYVLSTQSRRHFMQRAPHRCCGQQQAQLPSTKRQTDRSKSGAPPGTVRPVPTWRFPQYYRERRRVHIVTQKAKKGWNRPDSYLDTELLLRFLGGTWKVHTPRVCCDWPSIHVPTLVEPLHSCYRAAGTDYEVINK